MSSASRHQIAILDDSAEVDSNTRACRQALLKTGNNYRITIPYGSNRFEMTAIPERNTSTVTDNLANVFTIAEISYKQFVYFNDLPGEGEEKQYRITVTPQSGDNPRYYNFTVTIAKSDNKDLSRRYRIYSHWLNLRECNRTNRTEV